MPGRKTTAQTPDRRSPCPVACALDIFGDRWTLLVIRDLAIGKSQYKEFVASPEGIATNILADRLNRLVEQGIAERHADPGSPRRPTYTLTDKGRSLVPILQSIADWGIENIPGTAAHLRPRPAAM